MWIWQQPAWPNFTYNKSLVMPKLESCVRAVSPLKQLSAMLTVEQQLDWEAAILLDETLASAKIEGEHYDRDSVRSSIVNKLGLSLDKSKGNKFNKQSDAMVELLLSAIRNSAQPMTHELLKHWHQTLFPVAPTVTPITIGEYRDDEMQIISGRYGKQTVHFQAPCNNRDELNNEMTAFFDWLNSYEQESTFVKAAIAKFWFVTVHPFDDGNGRLSRVIAERSLAQAEDTNLRLFSLSSAIERNRSEYYEQLEKHQSCQLANDQQFSPLDLTQWVIWFLSMVESAALDAKKEFERVMETTRFWQAHQDINFNERQKSMLNRLLETNDFSDGISRKKYKALVKTTDATAVRDITALVENGVLEPIGEGRSRKYLVKKV